MLNILFYTTVFTLCIQNCSQDVATEHVLTTPTLMWFVETHPGGALVPHGSVDPSRNVSDAIFTKFTNV